MLEFKFEVQPSPEIMALLKEFRKTQVSRFPVIVEGVTPDYARFIDSRYDFTDPNEDKKDSRRIIGSVELMRVDAEQRCVYVVSSPNIRNNRYRKGSVDSHRQVTADAKKALKIVRDNVRPTPIESDIKKGGAARSGSQHKDMRGSWKHEPTNAIRGLVRDMNVQELARELVRLHDDGVGFKYSMCTDVAVKAKEMFVESERRVFSDERLYVMIQPDDSVVTVRVDRNDQLLDRLAEYANINGLPDDVQSKITLLRMTDRNNFYLGDVGYMVSHKEFWLDISL
jgi:hypothetical protein